MKREKAKWSYNREDWNHVEDAIPGDSTGNIVILAIKFVYQNCLINKTLVTRNTLNFSVGNILE